MLLMSALTSLVMGQLRSNIPMKTLPVNTQGLSHAQNLSFLDPSRFSMNHSFGMNMMSFGGNSMSVGSYTNQMNYMIKENMRLSTNFTLASPMNGTNPYSKNGFGGSQLFYGANLDYQPTKNLFLKFSMNNYPRYGYSQPYSRLYRSR
jgi:hypothetical protein|tara:strand:- start:173 stop:616 length:444 start_codon:yes stop_codon:yes gene_type:complete